MSDPEPSSGIGPASMMAARYWPRQSYLELRALPSAVPSARLHTRFAMTEWGLGALTDTVELIVSELVTNGVKASGALKHRPPVLLGLWGDTDQVLVGVWDRSDEPIHAYASGGDWPDFEAEGGRGLLLVDSLSTHWGACRLGDGHGKVVWASFSAVEVTDPGGTKRHVQEPLPRRVPSLLPRPRPVNAMDDLAVLRRVREGLKMLG
jgi:anti-sigma regulatory factor (Ser/Thr protein kinase)